jgi:4-hydroxybenzoate polyprenyltransferase
LGHEHLHGKNTGISGIIPDNTFQTYKKIQETHHMDKIHGYLKMLRTKDWIKFYPLFPLAGACLAAGISPDLIIVFALFFFITGYGFVINNLYDAKIDSKHSGKKKTGKNPFADNAISKGDVMIMCAVLAGIPLLWSLLISGPAFVCSLLCLIALTLYSAPPARFKDRFGADIVCHGLMFGGLPFLTGYVLAGGGIPGLFSLAAAAALVCTLICGEALIAHEIMDYHEDVGTTYTTVVGIGLRNGVLLLGITTLFSLVVFGVMAWWFAIALTINAVIFAFLIAYPLYSCRDILVPAAGKSCRVLMNDHLLRVR